MASNQYVNKVEYGGRTILDISGDTVTSSDVLSGVTFHNRSGEQQTGALIVNNVYDGLDSTSADDALSAKQGKVLYDKIKSGEFSPNTNDSLLTWINSTIDYNALPFSFIKIGSNALSDVPISDEFAGIIIGSNKRAIVKIIKYTSSNTNMFSYIRSIWNNAWNGDWYTDFVKTADHGLTPETGITINQCCKVTAPYTVTYNLVFNASSTQAKGTALIHGFLMSENAVTGVPTFVAYDNAGGIYYLFLSPTADLVSFSDIPSGKTLRMSFSYITQ